MKYHAIIGRFIMVVVVSSVLGLSLYAYRNQKIYESLSVNMKQEAKYIAYGSNINLEDLVDSASGRIIETSKIDTTNLGVQEANVTLKKENVLKTIPVEVEIVDLVAPVITTKYSLITVNKGYDYDLTNNIESVVDEIDGELPYRSEEQNGTYTFTSNYDKNTVGDYEINIKAVDNSGNESTETFTVRVKQPVVRYAVTRTAASNPSSSSLASTAISLIGSPYVAGGTSPAGFDCSGFVQYVYAVNGISIARGATSQSYNGVGVSYDSMQPGDIILWGNGSITHSSIYVGNGYMVHAGTSSTGVVMKSVAEYQKYSNTSIITIRRII